MSGRSIRRAVAAAVAGSGLIAGGLLFGTALVSAQDPTETPAAEESATPSDGADDSEKSDGEHNCPRDEDGSDSGSSGTSSGVRFRGRGGPNI